MTEKIVTIAGRQTAVTIERRGSALHIGDQVIEIVSLRDREAELRIGEKTFLVPFIVEGTNVSFVFDGETYVADVIDRGARTRPKHRDHSTAAPMPGLVAKILVAPGAVVVKGAPLLILEAMKMEHPIVAPRDGTVKAINCREGEMVQPGVELIELSE